MGTKAPQSIATTNALKGIAISAVLIDHYLDLNIRTASTGFANVWTSVFFFLSGDLNIRTASTGFANVWISVFFFLSGYSLFHSLDSRKLSNAKDLLLFYYQRIVRIFPLLWLAWIIQVIAIGDKLSPWTLLGIHASQHYWFIPALLQCYLVSPFIYFGLKKKWIIFLFSFLAMLALVNFLGYQAPRVIIRRAIFFHVGWRGMYFFHIMVFMFGMLFPLIISPSRKRNPGLVPIFLLWLLTFLITVFIIALRISSESNSIAKLSFNLAPLFLITFLCAYALYYSLTIRLLEYLGAISYSIYLFHVSYYKSINSIGAFSSNSANQLIAALVIFPIFIILCGQLENLGDYTNEKLRSLINPDTSPDRYPAGAF